MQHAPQREVFYEHNKMEDGGRITPTANSVAIVVDKQGRDVGTEVVFHDDGFDGFPVGEGLRIGQYLGKIRRPKATLFLLPSFGSQ